MVLGTAVLVCRPLAISSDHDGHSKDEYLVDVTRSIFHLGLPLWTLVPPLQVHPVPDRIAP